MSSLHWKTKRSAKTGQDGGPTLQVITNIWVWVIILSTQNKVLRLMVQKSCVNCKVSYIPGGAGFQPINSIKGKSLKNYHTFALFDSPANRCVIYIMINCLKGSLFNSACQKKVMDWIITWSPDNWKINPGMGDDEFRQNSGNFIGAKWGFIMRRSQGP